MTTALDSLVSGTEADAGGVREGLVRHFGSSMRSGARLEIWLSWDKLGEIECRVLTETCLEFHARGRFLGRAFDVPGRIELAPRGRCELELGHLCDSEARYCLQHKRPLVISEGFEGHSPSLRFWPEGAETRAELRCTVGRLRPRFDLVITAPRPPT